MQELQKLAPLKRHWLVRNSNIPIRYQGRDYTDIIEVMKTIPVDLTEWLDELLEGKVLKNPGSLGTTGVGILFDGKPGVGKTTHAVTTLSEFVYRLPDDATTAREILHMKPETYDLKARVVYYMTFTDLLSRKKAMFDVDSEERRKLHDEMEGFHGRAKDDHLNVRLLVLDDLGKEYGSKYDDFSFDDILRARYDNGLPTILTTNRDRENWNDNYSDAMASFAYEAFRHVRLDGADLRK
jgi:DNA replication protein DnaC